MKKSLPNGGDQAALRKVNLTAVLNCLRQKAPISRAALADALRRVLAAGIPIDGASDHGVSEALYLEAPDGLGVEVYIDRPREAWTFSRGQIIMVTKPLESRKLLAEGRVGRAILAQPAVGIRSLPPRGRSCCAAGAGRYLQRA